MEYIEFLNLLGVEARVIPCILGTGAPTTDLGVTGCLYMDEAGTLYKRGPNGWIVWESNACQCNTAALEARVAALETRVTNLEAGSGSGADHTGEVCQLCGVDDYCEYNAAGWCSHCGHDIERGGRYCSCGAKLNGCECPSCGKLYHFSEGPQCNACGNEICSDCNEFTIVDGGPCTNPDCPSNSGGGSSCPNCGSANWDGSYCGDCGHEFFGTCDLCGADLDATYACTDIECRNHPDNGGPGSSGGSGGSTCSRCGAALDENGRCTEPGPGCDGWCSECVSELDENGKCTNPECSNYGSGGTCGCGAPLDENGSCTMMEGPGCTGWVEE